MLVISLILLLSSLVNSHRISPFTSVKDIDKAVKILTTTNLEDLKVFDCTMSEPG